MMQGWRFLRRHGVDFNILCTINAANEKHGRTVYRFFRDEMNAKWLQFIPIVERASAETLEIANLGWSEQPGRKRLLYTQTGGLVTKRSVGGEYVEFGALTLVERPDAQPMHIAFIAEKRDEVVAFHQAGDAPQR